MVDELPPLPKVRCCNTCLHQHKNGYHCYRFVRWRTDPMTGEDVPTNTTRCVDERDSWHGYMLFRRKCGPKARYWEERP